MVDTVLSVAKDASDSALLTLHIDLVKSYPTQLITVGGAVASCKWPWLGCAAVPCMPHIRNPLLFVVRVPARCASGQQAWRLAPHPQGVASSPLLHDRPLCTCPAAAHTRLTATARAA